jgi:DNA mismatch repair ATPase MutS
MKAFLMHPDRDFNLQQDMPPNEPALMQDLELSTLFDAMAQGAPFLFEVAKRAVLSGSHDPDTIRYRQEILTDCLNHPSVVRELYRISVDALESRRQSWYGLSNRSPSSILYSAIHILEMSVRELKRMRKIADERANRFSSAGLRTFFAMLRRELDEEFFDSVREHLRELKFREGVLLSVELGEGNEGTAYTLRKPPGDRRGWIERIFAKKPPAYTFRIADRDEGGARILAGLENRGVNLVANALAQSADHIDSFFTLLKAELAFYIGCLNLHERLIEQGAPISFPLPVMASDRRHAFRGLNDICLALTVRQKVVGNDANADRKDLVIVTGANQGGKSTFLRSVGLAQLMMQSGMFVPAESFCSNVCAGLFTHYKREEDATMKSGKLDEELGRMSDIADRLAPDAMILFNESFTDTNEREGSEIARQIVFALQEKRIKIFFVTHLYEFARGLYEEQSGNVLFLRAERQADGTRTFRLREGEPLQTSYGEDLYRRIFLTND